MFNNRGTDQCPLLDGDCMGHRCKLWVHLRGLNPQTGQEIDKADCTFTFLPLLLVENSQQQRQTAAAVESFRNEMIGANTRTLQAMIEASRGVPALGRDVVG